MWGYENLGSMCRRKVYSKLSQPSPYHPSQLHCPYLCPEREHTGGSGNAGTYPENHQWKVLPESVNYKVNNMWLGEMGGYEVAYPEWSYKYKQYRLSGGYYKITETKRSETLLT